MARFSPWRHEMAAPLNALQSELNRILEEYWNPVRFGPAPTAPTDLEPSGWSPAIDLYETPEETILLAELPGVEPSSIELTVTGNVLTLKGQKPRGDAPEEVGTLHERQYGPFHRQIPLSSEVNYDAAQAEVRNGILKVRLPRKESAKPRTIPIQPD